MSKHTKSINILFQLIHNLTVCNKRLISVIHSFRCLCPNGLVLIFMLFIEAKDWDSDL